MEHPDSTDRVSAEMPLSLHEERTVLWVNRRLFYGNLAIAALLGAGFHAWKFMGINLLVHAIAAWVTIRSPDLPAIYLRYRRQDRYYRPWGEPLVRNRRPDGFGRNMGT